MHHHKVRIKDIAERSGVSSGTVDRVLHNRGHVAAEVRARVMDALKELGYVPNIMARTLANNRTLTIAAVLPDYRTDPYWVQPKEGVEMALQAMRHYGIAVQYYFFDLFAPSDFQRQAALALDSNPDALLTSPLFQKEAEQLLASAQMRDLPVVLINTDIPHAQALCYIGQDSYQSGFLAARLLDFGLQDGSHVMVLNLDKSVSNARHLLEKARGFRDYFVQQSQPRRVTVHTESFEAFDQPGALKAWLKVQFQRYGQLSGFFVTNSRAYWLAEALGEPFLPKVKMVGFDLIEPNLELLNTGGLQFIINQNAWHQGYLGVASIVQHLILHKEIQRTHFLPLDIVVRENASYYLRQSTEMMLGAL